MSIPVFSGNILCDPLSYMYHDGKMMCAKHYMFTSRGLGGDKV